MDDCGLAVVDSNYVYAAGSMYVEIHSAPTSYEMSSGSAMALLNSQILSSIYDSVNTSVNSESINAQFNGSLPSVETFDLGGGLCGAIGILAIDSNGVCITGNTQAQGVANIMGLTSTLASIGQYEAEGWSAGLAVGGGIWVICSDGAKVNGNTDVVGTGLANIQVGALHEAPVVGQDAEAFGGGAGVGVGILIIGEPTGQATSQEQLDELTRNRPVTEVCGNTVAATGTADPICVSAEDQNFATPDNDHSALGTGLGLGLAIGIGTLWTPCIVIQGNSVTADGLAIVCASAQSVEVLDPLSIGGAAGIGVGIITVCSHKAQIIDNTSVGTGVAKGFVMAIEHAVPPMPLLPPRSAAALVLATASLSLVAVAHSFQPIT